MTKKAHKSFTKEQREGLIEGAQRLVHFDTSMIERADDMVLFDVTLCTIVE